jgi:N-acyl-D-aspartate/D-glutamate deacylase
MLMAAAAVWGQSFDVVISGGRVIDPESGLNAVRNVGISGGKVKAVSASPLTGRRTVDARGLVVAPGFIDLHWHGRDPASDAYEAMDGVTASFELEIGVPDIDEYYVRLEGRSMIHHGAAIGHVPVRMKVMGDSGDFLPADKAIGTVASPEQITGMRMLIEGGLKRGAVGVGFGLAYVPAASYWEVVEMFRIAAANRASCHVHLRGASSAMASENGRIQGLMEVIAAAAITGAPLQVVHINSSGLESTDKMLGMIAGARKRGLDVTTECYPYTAGATRIESAIFDGWETKPDEWFQTLQWVGTRERLTRNKFVEYRKQRGLVIVHANTEENVRTAVLSPLTMIASDGFDTKPGEGHPRSSGSFSKILGQYVREERALKLEDAVAKMTLMPARRLEARVPAMKNKGRIRVGADADVVVFDPEKVRDRSSYEKPSEFSEGMRFVFGSGVAVVDDGRPAKGVFPGRGIRAEVR